MANGEIIGYEVDGKLYHPADVTGAASRRPLMQRRAPPRITWWDRLTGRRALDIELCSLPACHR